MANFVDNKPKFKVGDKVVYTRHSDYPVFWETQSIDKGPLTIRKVNAFYTNDELTDVHYFVEGLDYVYSENWLSYAPAGPKFKIGDLVHNNIYMKTGTINDIITKTYASNGHQEYLYKIKLESSDLTFCENSLTPATSEEALVHDLEICGGENSCIGCSRDNPNDRTGIGCDKLELDAAELIKKLQKRIKELEKEKK